MAVYARNTMNGMLPYCHFHGCLRFWSICVLAAASCFCKTKIDVKLTHGPLRAAFFQLYVMFHTEQLAFA